MNVSELMKYEDGQLSEDETITLFQKLIDSGMAWELQGHYGRTAAALVKAGHCHLPGHEPVKATVGRRPHVVDDDDVYAMHGIDDGPDPHYMDDLINHREERLKLAEEKHVGAIWGQEPE